MRKKTTDNVQPNEVRPLADLTPDDRNANRGTERGTGMLEESLRKHGAGRSVLADRKLRIIAGNKTVEGAAALGMDEVIVVQTDGSKLVVVQRTDLDLDSPEGRELALRDNRTGEVNLEWDEEELARLAAEGVDLAGMWTEDELAALSQEPPPPPSDFSEHDENISTEHECPKCGYKWSGGGGKAD